MPLKALQHVAVRMWMYLLPLLRFGSPLMKSMRVLSKAAASPVSTLARHQLR